MADSKLFSRRDFLKLGGVAFAAGALGLRIPSFLAGNRREDVYYRVFRHGRRDQAQIALSYDDCHLVTKLQALEAILRTRPHIKVTFFPTGEALLNTHRKDAGIWQRFLEAGHEIGSHTFDHVNPGVRSTKNLVEDHAKWLAAFYRVTETFPEVRFARPPYGNLSPSFQEMCAQLGLVAVLWSGSWGGELDLAQKNIEAVENGDIILMHPSAQDVDINTPFGLSILDNLDIRAVTMSELYFSALEDRMGLGSCEALSYDGQNCPD